MKQLQYYANFYAADDTLYRIEIYKESADQLTAEEVELVADGATVEWGEAKKLEDPVQGSSATLRLLSVRDRQFYDLYAVDYGEVELRIYRNGAIYWIGTLDPELFEEPYAYADNYVTEITFADLAMLEYRYWERHGLTSIREIVAECLSVAGLQDLPIREIVSTECEAPYEEAVSPFECYIDADNFFDEDGDAMTLREVLEEVLRPFALRLLQKGGEIVVFDLHALYSEQTKEIEWYSADATLGTDSIYNSVELTFSPYSSQTILLAELDAEEDVADATNKVTVSGTTDKYSTTIVGGTGLAGIDCFELFYTNEGGTRRNFTAQNGARFFRINPIFSGSKEAGVLWAYQFGGEWTPNNKASILGDDMVAPPNFFAFDNAILPIIALPKVYISADAYNGSNTYDRMQLCLSLTAMFDPRRNPFESADFFVDSSETEDDYEHQEDKGVYAYIPVLIYLCNSEGTREYVYLNNVERVGADEDSVYGWQNIADLPSGTPHRSWLCYYDANEGGKGKMFGWATNGRIAGKATKAIPESWKRKNNGEYIPTPPVSGYLEVVICAGIVFHNKDKKLLTYSNRIYAPSQGMIAYKEATIKIVPANGPDEIDDLDLVSTAYINKSAREELTIDTIVGSIEYLSKAPASKAVLRTSAGKQITRFHRRIWVDRIEELLLDTAISQFAQRKATLEGTIVLNPSFCSFTDASADGKFVSASEVQNLMKSTSEVKVVEFVEDQNNEIEEVV